MRFRVEQNVAGWQLVDTLIGVPIGQVYPDKHTAQRAAEYADWQCGFAHEIAQEEREDREYNEWWIRELQA